jgi:hypothetical protein
VFQGSSARSFADPFELDAAEVAVAVVLIYVGFKLG